MTSKIVMILAFLFISMSASAQEPTKKEKPPRCLVAKCAADYSYGLAFRPSVELANAYGAGFGFSEDFKSSFQLASSLGARFFWMDDWMDVRLGVGFVSVPENSDLTYGFLWTTGIGFIEGLLGIAYVGTVGFADRTPGYGGVISADFVAIQNLVYKD